MIEEMTVDEMRAKEAEYREKIAMERKRQAVAAAWYIGSGRPSLVKWDEVQAAFSKYDYWSGEINKFETEIQMRLAMAWGACSSSSWVPRSASSSPAATSSVRSSPASCRSSSSTTR